jgi:hypothetical protein
LRPLRLRGEIKQSPEHRKIIRNCNYENMHLGSRHRQKCDIRLEVFNFVDKIDIDNNTRLPYQIGCWCHSTNAESEFGHDLTLDAGSSAACKGCLIEFRHWNMKYRGG